MGFSKYFKVYKQIGEGNHANVYWAKRISDNEHVAVKAISKEIYAEENGKVRPICFIFIGSN
jgi:serine/threonine protein kinase